ncbi:hypothetical protein [Pseudomonas panipatensis]|nr:hypothetical protein [Pseudomonas panipatensis]SMP72414.1 hypothetical protein SAMN06295951_1113 [Pseudomonas panipatensis]
MRHLLFWVLCLVASAALATPTPRAVPREYMLDSCHFKFMDPYNGRIDVDNESSSHSASYIADMKPGYRHAVGEVSIHFYCDTMEGNNAFVALGFEKQGRAWVLLPNKSDPDNLLNKKLYPLKSPGIEGAASTYDQTTGERSRRFQGLGFCLTDQKQILCGVSETVGYVAYPKASSLPQVLKLLESIEFLEPAAKSP